MSALVSWREISCWTLVDGELVIGGAASGSCGVFEPSIYCRMSPPIDKPTEEEDTSTNQENKPKRCVQATVITPNAPIVSVRLENNLDMALRVESVVVFVQALSLASTTATQHDSLAG